MKNQFTDIVVKYVDSTMEQKEAFAIRKKVFIEEQSVDPSIEMDGFDDSATHIFAEVKGKPVWTARWRETENGIKLERFAVLPSFRGLNVGKKLVEFSLEQLREQENIYLHAQESVIRFYEKLGFKCQGEIFYEAEIPHKKMIYKGEMGSHV